MLDVLEVTSIILGICTVMFGSLVSLFVLYKACVNRTFRQNYPIELNIVAVDMLVCIGVVPTRILCQVLNRRLYVETNVLCVFRTFLCSLSFTVILMTLIFFTIYRIRHVKRGYTCGTKVSTQVKIICIIWLVGITSTCNGLVNFVNIAKGKDTIFSEACLPHPRSINTTYIFEVVFPFCLLCCLFISMVMCWILIVRHIRLSHRIGPVQSQRLTILHQDMFNTIANERTPEHSVPRSEVHMKQKLSEESSIRNVSTRLHASMRRCKSYEIRQTEERRQYSDGSCPSIQLTTYSDNQQNRRRLSRSCSAMNITEKPEYLRLQHEKNVSNNSQVAKSRNGQRIADAVMSLKKVGKSCPKLRTGDVNSNSANVQNIRFFSRNTSILSHYLGRSKSEGAYRQLSTSSSGSSHHSRQNLRKVRSFDGRFTSNKIQNETRLFYIGSTTSSSPSSKFSELKINGIDLFTDNSKLDVDFPSRCQSKFSQETISSVSSIYISETTFTLYDADIISGNDKKHCPIESNRLKFSDISFTSSEKVQSWIQNNINHEQVDENKEFIQNDLSEVSAFCQEKDIGNATASPNLPVQIKITTAEDQMIERRSATIPEYPLLNIEKAIDQSSCSGAYRQLVSSPSRRASRSQPATSVSKRMFLAIILSLLMVPYFVVHLIFLCTLVPISPGIVAITSSLAELTFAINPFLYVLYNTKIMKLIRPLNRND